MMGPWTLMRHLSDGGSGPRNCESCKRHHAKRGSCEKRHFRPEGIPESAGDDTCNQHGDTTRQVEDAKGSATQIFGRRVGDQSRCYGGCGEELTVGGLLTERWHPSVLL